MPPAKGLEEDAEEEMTMAEEFHPIHSRGPSPAESEAIMHWRVEFARLHGALMALPNNREAALARTHLEDCAMRVERAILAGEGPKRS